MRYFILLFLFSFLVAEPTWFYHIKSLDNQIIGYGVSTNLEKAKEFAKNEVASAISTRVDSYLEIDKNLNNNKSNKKIELSIKVTTNVKLEDLYVIRSEFIDNKWYIGIGYDYSPFAVKFKKKLIGYHLKDSLQNDFLKRTVLVNNLNTIIGKKLPYRLYNKNGSWYLSYNYVSLKLNQEDFSNLFAFKNSKFFDIELNKDIYLNNDKFSLFINSKLSGYFSIFYVGHNGQVGLLKPNVYIDSKDKYMLDDNIIIKNSSKKEQKFMIVIFYSKTRLLLDKFDKLGRMKINNYDFTKLLPLFDKHDYLVFVSKISI